jgi:hypothetical protein
MSAYNLLKYLENEGFGSEGLDLFINFKPSLPDDCIIFYDESATPPPESSGLSVDIFGVQIIVRNTNQFTAENISKLINKKIIGFGGIPLIIGGDIVSQINQVTAPFSIGKDDNERNEWSSHYTIRMTSENNTFRL